MVLKKSRFKNIEFVIDEPFFGAAPDPTPAVLAVPPWYKDATPTIDHTPWGVDLDDQGMVSGSSPRSTFKNCVPFLDAMSLGYVLPLWNDFIYEFKNGRTYFSWPGEMQLVNSHPKWQTEGVPAAEKALDQSGYKFVSPWTIQTPKGYSCLFTMPFNHFEDRFGIATGVVDTDVYHNNVSFPFFWLAEGTSGTIQLGDPLVQVIPFKREDYRMTVREKNDDDRWEENRVQRLISSVSQYAYRLNFHKKKSYH